MREFHVIHIKTQVALDTTQSVMMCVQEILLHKNGVWFAITIAQRNMLQMEQADNMMVTIESMN